jgi:hypothetical protein
VVILSKSLRPHRRASEASRWALCANALLKKR